jgi:hypothetical protein
MHLMRHTKAGAAAADGHLVDGHAPYYTTLAQRQAMLKMFAADYCGTGRAFTVDGQPLQYRDSTHWYPGASTPSLPDSWAARGVEALWSERGAVCLDTPRRVTREEVEAACPGIPTCGGPAGVVHWDEAGSWDAMAGVHVISANPPCGVAP